MDYIIYCDNKGHVPVAANNYCPSESCLPALYTRVMSCLGKPSVIVINFIKASYAHFMKFTNILPKDDACKYEQMFMATIGKISAHLRS